MIKTKDVLRIMQMWKTDLSIERDAFLFIELSMKNQNDFSKVLFYFHSDNKDHMSEHQMMYEPLIQKVMDLLFGQETVDVQLSAIIQHIYTKAQQQMVCHLSPYFTKTKDIKMCIILQ